MLTNNVDINSANAQSHLDRLLNITNSQVDEERADKAAIEFEEMMFGHLVKYMFETTEGSAIWGEGHGADIMRSMFIDAIAKSGGAKSLNIRNTVKKNLYQPVAPQDCPFEDAQNKRNLDVSF